MGGFDEVGEDSASRDRAELEVRLAEVQEQFRATSDILKVLTSSSGDPDGLRRGRRERPDAAQRVSRQIYLVKGGDLRPRAASGHSEEHRRSSTNTPSSATAARSSAA